MLPLPNEQTLQHLARSCCGNPPPLLPKAALEAHVSRFFVRGQDFLDLAREQGSPLYVFEPETLRQKIDLFRQSFTAQLPNCGFFFAMKSNNCPELVRTVVQSGFGLDVSSGLELEMALALNAGEIVFSGPGKTGEELRLASSRPDRVTVLLDSFTEIERLDGIVRQSGKRVPVGVRLCTQPHGLWRKFGILPAELGDFLEALRSCPGLSFRGLQFHTSWNRDPRAQVDFITQLGPILRELLPTDLEQIRFLDIGGGYWPEQGEWLQEAATPDGRLSQALDLPLESGPGHYHMPAQPLTVFARELSEAIQSRLTLPDSCRICFEPGRWLCHESMHLLLTVVDRKGNDIVITDAGTNAVGWERFEHDYFPVLNLSRPQRIERPCMVLGSLCTPHDLWGYHYWGADIRTGDVLLIPDQGAYTYSLRQHFIKPLPSVAVLRSRTQPQGDLS